MDIFILLAFDIPFGALLWDSQTFAKLLVLSVRLAALSIPFVLLWAYIWVL